MSSTTLSFTPTLAGALEDISCNRHVSIAVLLLVAYLAYSQYPETCRSEIQLASSSPMLIRGFLHCVNPYLPLIGRRGTTFTFVHPRRQYLVTTSMEHNEELHDLTSPIVQLSSCSEPW